eukprot:s273_g16.t1
MFEPLSGAACFPQSYATMPKFVLCFSLLVAFLSVPFLLLSSDLSLLQSFLRFQSLFSEQRSGALEAPEAPDIPAVPDAPSKRDPSCQISSRSLDWGWEEACHLTNRGDEACEMFLASKMYQDERIFVETARRSFDRTYHPNLARLKARVVQAVSEGRPVKIVGLGPSTTKGLGCQNEHLRWTDSLQNLSNFSGSPMRLEVINEARPGTTVHTMWHNKLAKYHKDLTLDVVIVDYSVTAEHLNFNTAKSAVMVLYSGLQSWKRPPALLFIETFSLSMIRSWKEDSKPCSFGSFFDASDSFFHAAKTMQLPLLSYPDVACQMPPLNRSTRSINKMPFLHAYDDIRRNPIAHYGCGVHFILAHALHLYLLQMLQESCDAGSQKVCTGTLKDFCEKGFQQTLKEEKMR